MKLCPQCKTGFPDQAETCPTHGILLSEIIDLKPGMLIRNTYRIVRKLGEGGMGAVYLADQTLMDEPRAIKFLGRQWSRDEAFTARFRREVRTLRQVRHKNVIDSGDLEQAEDESLFFAMEFVDGPDLRSFLDRAPRPFDVQMALELTRSIAEGLGAAHAKGMVHRDIKPENVLMAREGNVLVPKIADFGIVATKESSATRTRTGASLLTYPYAAPEQWRGMKSAELDGRTDIYALGGVLFEMLTGETAFDAESYEGWAEQHKNVPPRPPGSVRPDLAKWEGLDALVLRMLAKDREDRPHDIPELLSLLEAVSYAPRQRRVTVREEPAPVSGGESLPASSQPPPRPEPEPEPVVPETGKAAQEQFDPQKHVRITSGLWLRRVPAWKVVLTLFGFIAVVAALGYLFNSLSTPLTSTTQTDPSSLVGKLAPDFVIVPGPKPTRLSDYRGDLVLLNFWASYSPPSIEDISSLSKLRHELPAISVIAVSEDEDRAAFKAFIEKHRPNLVALRDSNRTTANLYHTSMWPETYVIDRQGVVRRKFTGAQDWSSPEIRAYLDGL
jgi:serine/threonine-protein kinase